MANVKIREVIHHGDYRHTRVMEVYKLTPLTVRGVLMSSAYCYELSIERRLAEIVSELSTTGIAHVGWSTFTIEES